ncbi:hypothetical protein [Trichormus sp. NMC-1]|nr:hypothetical protein [Trichormus sp. NMC-1]
MNNNFNLFAPVQMGAYILRGNEVDLATREVLNPVIIDKIPF